MSLFVEPVAGPVQHASGAAPTQKTLRCLSSLTQYITDLQQHEAEAGLFRAFIRNENHLGGKDVFLHETFTEQDQAHQSIEWEAIPFLNTFIAEQNDAFNTQHAQHHQTRCAIRISSIAAEFHNGTFYEEH